MHIEVGGISAKCLVCGSNDFESLRPKPDEPSDKLACTGCCTEFFYDDLLQWVEPRSLAAKRRTFRGRGRSDCHSVLKRTFIPLRPLLIDVPAVDCLHLYPGCRPSSRIGAVRFLADDALQAMRSVRSRLAPGYMV